MLSNQSREASRPVRHSEVLLAGTDVAWHFFLRLIIIRAAILSVY